MILKERHLARLMRPDRRAQPRFLDRRIERAREVGDILPGPFGLESQERGFTFIDSIRTFSARQGK